MGNEIKQIQEAQMELRAGICHLIEADLREICTELHIELKEKDTGPLALIQTVPNVCYRRAIKNLVGLWIQVYGISRIIIDI